MKRLLIYIFIFVFPLQSYGALTFGTGTTDRVNYGSAATLDNLTTFTIAMWIKPASVANTYRGWAGKYDNVSTGWEINQLGTNGTILRTTVRRSGGNLRRDSSSGALTAGAWQFVAVTWDTSANDMNVYVGSTTRSVQLVNGTLTNTGTTMTNDSALDLHVGRASTGATGSANSDIAWVGIWNRQLSLGELRAQQFNPHVTSGTVLFSYMGHGATSGLGTQPDLSGKRNSGTITGATLSRHVPIRLLLR